MKPVVKMLARIALRYAFQEVLEIGDLRRRTRRRKLVAHPEPGGGVGGLPPTDTEEQHPLL